MATTRPAQDLDRTEIVLWGKENCAKCEATKRFFTERGIAYEERSLVDDPGGVFEYARENNITEAPVVVTGRGEVWGGYDRFHLEKTAHALGKTQVISRTNSPSVPRDAQTIAAIQNGKPVVIAETQHIDITV